MKSKLVGTLLLGFLQSHSWAGLTIKSEPTVPSFEKYVQEALQTLESSGDANLKKLLSTARGAPLEIVIGAVTEDRSTWHEDGNKTRSHVNAVGKKKWNEGKFIALPCNVFLYSPSDYKKEIKKGTLAHELVHAIDMTYGYYDRDYTIREKRAVFFQNINREHRRHKLRADYHDRFPTLEYQNAKAQGSVQAAADFILSQGGLP